MGDICKCKQSLWTPHNSFRHKLSKIKFHFFPQTFRNTEKSDKGPKGESKGTMKNYQFYLDHYWSNMESLKSEKDLYLMADENTSKGSLRIEPLFLKEAIDILCDCR